MNTINKSKIYGIVFSVLVISLLLSLLGCKKDHFARGIVDDDIPVSQMELPQVHTEQISNISQISAQSGGEVIENGGGLIRSAGIVWAENSAPTVDDFKNSNGFTKGEFRSLLTKLRYGTTYYVRAYATNSKGTAYGEEFTFTTPSPLAPVETLPITLSGGTSLKTGGKVLEFEDSVFERGICWSIVRTPTIDDNKIVSTGSDIEFVANIPNFQSGKTYRVRAYTITPGGISYGNVQLFNDKSEVILDPDGNAYTSVKIGNQVWMAENYQSTKYRDGSLIAAGDLLTGNQGHVDKYGQLYSGHAAMHPSNLAPEGWRVPTAADWETLIATVGGISTAGGKLKDVDAWTSPNSGATNEFGFTALPGGLTAGNAPNSFETTGIWWTTSTSSGADLWRFAMVHNAPNMLKISNARSLKFSIRLIKE